MAGTINLVVPVGVRAKGPRKGPRAAISGPTWGGGVLLVALPSGASMCAFMTGAIIIVIHSHPLTWQKKRNWEAEE